MRIFGLTIGDLLGLITLFSTIGGALFWLVKVAVLNKYDDMNADLKAMLKSLQIMIDNINDNAETKHSIFDERLDKHDQAILVHEQRIKANEARINKLEDK